jgi:hypothetical protein
MFTFSDLSARSRRLGIGVAVAALALASYAAPMTVSAHEGYLDTGESLRMSRSEDVNWSPPPQADLKVTARGKRTEGGVTKFFFVISNNGPANAAPINAYKEAQAKPMLGSGLMLLDDGYFVIPSLAPGASKSITVSCAPPAGFVCKQATTLTLNNSYDPNGANNIATIN